MFLLVPNIYFQKAYPALQQAQKEGKDVTEEEKTLKLAAQKHIAVLTFLKTEAPSSVVWKPEKEQATAVSFDQLITEAIAIRKQAL